MMEAEPKIGNAPPQYFDAEKGLLQSRVFSDPVIYRAELAGIFHRAWLFLGPEKWLMSAGDFITSRMGGDEVLVWRGDDGVARAFTNLCLAGHRPLCSQPRGHAMGLRCPCHGWPYDSRGRSFGRSGQVLPTIARVETYKGLIFGNEDFKAAPLTEWLGDFAWYLDLLLARRAGGVEVYGGDSIRWTAEANWKLPAQAFSGDTYRDLRLAAQDDAASPAHTAGNEDEGFQVSAGPGTMAIRFKAAIAAESGQPNQLGDPRDSLTPTTGTLFPNLSFDGETPSLHVWHPVGPSRTEIHSFCIVDRDAPAAEKEASLRAFQFLYGPGGLRSQADFQLWKSITSRATKHRDSYLNLQMGLGRERQANLPGIVGHLLSESNQRAFFGWWQRNLAIRSDVPRRWLRAVRSESPL